MIDDYVKMISNYSKLIQIEGRNSWRNIDFTNNEPEIIEDYLLTANKGVDYLNRNVAQIITSETKYEVKFASVFCHQKPRITRTVNSINKCKGGTKGCELGDLMTIFVLLDRNKNIVHSTAKIMQAKKKDVLDSESQKCLYESDLDFIVPKNMIKYSSCSDSLRLLPTYNDDRDKALSYLILNSGNVINKEIPNSSNLSYDWSYHLQLMMEFKTGKKFSIPTEALQNDWDCIIHDLINIGTGVNPSSKNRGNGFSELIDSFNYFFFYPEYKLEFDFQGISTMLIICKDTERAYEK